MTLPDITPRQQDILKQLYRYRYLNRIHIQSLLHHKDYHRINAWLKDLRDKHYVEWIYSDHFVYKTKPAIYYLGINGIRYLRQFTVMDANGNAHEVYPATELRKRYRDAQRTTAFIDHCLIIAGSCIALKKKSGSRLRYGTLTPADYAHPNHTYHFISQLEGVSPSLCIVYYQSPEASDGSVAPDVIANYLLEVFDPTTPRYVLRNRLRNYIRLLADDDWESKDNDPSPIILMAVPNLTDLIYAKRRGKYLIGEQWDYDDPDRPHIRFATLETLKAKGITEAIWEEGRGVYDV